MTKITIGARGSKLSIAYVEKVKELLIQRNKDLNKENIYFKAIKTSGDINQNKKCSEALLNEIKKINFENIRFKKNNFVSCRNVTSTYSKGKGNFGHQYLQCHSVRTFSVREL